MSLKYTLKGQSEQELSFCCSAAGTKSLASTVKTIESRNIGWRNPLVSKFWIFFAFEQSCSAIISIRGDGITGPAIFTVPLDKESP
ncbi:MAG: hypothetical protein KAY65_10295 [Planctomycetes bacterium]|nr:hypothetical protein [Planctomycetota bacterium]